MSTPAERLNEFLTQEERPREAFRIETKDQAIWSFRKLQKLAAQEAEAKEVARREIDKINTWLKGETDKVQDDRAFFQGALTEYHKAEFAKDDKAKSIKFAGFGTLKSKAQQPDVTYDEPAVKEWAKSNAQEFVVTPPPPEPKLAWGELKKKLDFKNGQAVYKETGEIVPDIVVVDRERKFEVEIE